MKWKILEDCGNSPKNKMLVDWTVDFVEQEGEMTFISEDSIISYKGEDIPLIDFEIPVEISEIQITQSITHGRIGALLGKALTDNHDYPFSLFFEFSLGKQPKIKTLNCIVDRI